MRAGGPLSTGSRQVLATLLRPSGANGSASEARFRLRKEVLSFRGSLRSAF